MCASGWVGKEAASAVEGSRPSGSRSACTSRVIPERIPDWVGPYQVLDSTAVMMWAGLCSRRVPCCAVLCVGRLLLSLQVSSPYEVAEFDIMFGEGINALGCLFDVAKEMDVVEARVSRAAGGGADTPRLQWGAS